MVTKQVQYDKQEQINWLRVVNYLTARATRNHLPLPRRELRPLAALAAAKAGAYYARDRATCSFRQWVYSQGWRLLLSEVRDELRRRRRSVPTVTFTDLWPDSEPAQRSRQAQCAACRVDDPIPPGELLEDLLVGLSRMDRGIVRMRVARQTYSQIARVSGLSGEAIRLRLVRLRPLLEGRLRRR